jgi:hypothetical protein
MLLLSFATLAGCRSTNEALLDKAGKPLAKMDPAAYRLAVAPFQIDPTLKENSGLWGLKRSAEELQQDLVRALEELRTASDIVALDSADSLNAYQNKADLLLVPRLREASFKRTGSSRTALSSALWFTTWIGSLYVEDASYDARFMVEYDLIDPYSGVHVADDEQASSNAVDLTFLERNDAFSGNFFLTMLIPPFLTADDEKITAEALLQKSTTLVAAQLKTYLKETLPSRELALLTSVHLWAPTNGARLTGPTDLHCDIIAKRVVTEIVVLVNDNLYRKWEESELPSVGEQAWRGNFRCPVNLESIEVDKPGKNIIRLLFNVAGQWASRSILVYRAPTKKQKGSAS